MLIPEEEKKYFAKICNWLKKSTGLHFPPSKQATLLSKLYQLCERIELKNLQELSNHLENDYDCKIKLELLSIATTHHTYFFREEIVCNYFADTIVKQFVNKPIRIWSSACSSGEEAYTLAIILSEYPGIDTSKVSILGTDVDPQSIQRAEAGIYNANSIKNIPENLLAKYFIHTVQNQWELKDDIKKMCTFRRLNLKSEPWPFHKKFDLIACRNVLYYFDQPNQQKLVNRLYDISVEQGWLLTSVTESFYNIDTQWSMVISGVYKK